MLRGGKIAGDSLYPIPYFFSRKEKKSGKRLPAMGERFPFLAQRSVSLPDAGKLSAFIRKKKRRSDKISAFLDTRKASSYNFSWTKRGLRDLALSKSRDSFPEAAWSLQPARRPLPVKQP
jgi:hypothetical protein